MKAILSLIISGALVVSGLGQTRNVLVGTNNTVVQPTNFWSVDAANARTGLGLGTAATNPASAFQPSSSVLSNLASSNAVNLTNLRATNIVGTIPATNIGSLTLTNIAGTLAISNGGSGATTDAEARTNFGLGATWLTNTVASDFRTAIGLSLAALTNTNASNFRVAIGATAIGNALFTATNSAAAIDAIGISTNFSDQLLSVSNIEIGVFPEGSGRGFVVPTSGQTLQLRGTNVVTTIPAFYGFSGFESTAFSVAEARTNLGLNAWTTNTNSPVFVGTNGEVVSPTNFWQVAPIVTRFVEFDPATNASTNIVAARNLHIHSLAISRTGVTSTIVLPTNGATFDGDIALVVHQGPTSSMTRVQVAGSTNNLITMTRFDEAIEFVFYENVWQFNHNQSFIEPIYFSGTNAAANAAASRTNLGLGATNDVTFNNITIADQTLTLSHGPETDVVLRNESGQFEVDLDGSIFFLINQASGYSQFNVPVQFNNTTNAATTRTNLGLGLPALTNTNAAGFQRAIFSTNAAPTNTANVNGVGFNTAVQWMEISIVTNSVTNSYRIPLFQ